MALPINKLACLMPRCVYKELPHFSPCAQASCIIVSSTHQTPPLHPNTEKKRVTFTVVMDILMAGVLGVCRFWEAWNIMAASSSES